MPSPLEPGSLSAWRDTGSLDDTKAREQAERLEHRARAADEAAARRDYLDLLRIVPGERILDVGCGSGVVTREIAQRVIPGGKVVGTDSSAAFLSIARDYADAAGCGHVIEWRLADCRALRFADGHFDAVIAATVLAHVPGAERALTEMVRVTRPGGRVAVFDFDGDGLFFTHPDRNLTRRIVAAQCDYGAVNGHLIREMPGILTKLGLEDVKAKAFMPLEREAGSFYADMARRAAKTAVQAGAITDGEFATWLRGFEGVVNSGRFIGGRLQLFVWGTRPNV